MIPTLPALSFFLISLAIGPNFGYFNGDFGPIVLITAAFLLFLFYVHRKAIMGDPKEGFPTEASPGLIENRSVNRKNLALEAQVGIPACRQARPEGQDPWKSHIPASFLCLITFAAYLFYMWGQWIKDSQYFNIIYYLSYFLLFAICYLLFAKIAYKFHKGLYLMILTTAFLIRLLVILASPSPTLDVFVILKEAPAKLLSGVNPYTTLYTYVFPGITPDYYAYWPAAIVLQIPFIQLFHDPRVLLILADIAAAILLYLISGKSKTGMFLSLTYLFRPQTLYILEASWLTPLNFFFVTLLVYILKHRYAGDPKEGFPTEASPGLIENRSVSKKDLALEAEVGTHERQNPHIVILIGILLGILTSIQFFHAVIFFFLAKYLNWSKKFIAAFITTVGIFVIPFLILSPSRFINQTLLVYFKAVPHPSILIHTSLSLNTLFWTITKTDILSFILYPLILIIFVFLFMKQKQKLSAVLVNIILFFLAVFLFGRQAFVNYYYFVTSLLILYLSLHSVAQTNH